MKNKYFYSLFIILTLTVLMVPLAGAADVDFLYKIENNDGLNNHNLLGIQIENRMDSDYLFSASGFTGNLINDEEDCQQFNINMHKKMNFKSDFDYYLGAGYNYSFNDSDELKKNLLFLSLKGINERSQYSVISKVSYAPLGTYSFTGEDLENMSAWDIKLTFKTYIGKNFNLSLTGAMGGETFQDFSVNKNEYLIGVGWDL